MSTPRKYPRRFHRAACNSSLKALLFCIDAFQQSIKHFTLPAMFYITTIDARIAIITSLIDIRIHRLSTGCDCLPAISHHTIFGTSR